MAVNLFTRILSQIPFLGSRIRGKSLAAESAGTLASEKSSPARSPEQVKRVRRRIVWACVGTYLGANFLMFLRFFFPRTLLEPKTVFSIGFPSDYALGVSTKFQKQFRIWVVRVPGRLFVIYARCTHLGCTPDWKEGENKFKCPCHGSGYDSEGTNFEGPAPRPMDRARVSLDAEGKIIVDTSILYNFPKGERSSFDDEGAFLSI